jgi:AcrR family transcriptional regulator
VSEPSEPRPYETLLAKGEDRRNRILEVAQRILIRNGWRNTSLNQIAREAGVSTPGLLHHFASKEQLLIAVLDARDANDDARADRSGDIIEQIERAGNRFIEAPHSVGLFNVLLVENLEPDDSLHDRLINRYWVSVETVAEGIRRGQRSGEFRTDIDPMLKAVEVIAFVNGMETSWLLDPSIPVSEVFRDYAQSLAHQLAPQPELA